jgi:peptidoglycan/LPS O-acetylase OafA/YrhL
LIVFLSHAFFSVSSEIPLVNFFLVILAKNNWIGVDLFFMLSGFLITHLLLKERQKYHSLSIKKFYIRRILRIWPLYYLAIILGFFIFPSLFSYFFDSNFNTPQLHEQFKTHLPLHLIFMGNWAVATTPGYTLFPNTAQLWTISVEEQFYIVWPLVLKFTNTFKKALVVTFAAIAVAMVFRFMLALQNIPHPGIYTNTFARMDTLVFGTMLAFIYYYKPLWIQKMKILLFWPFQLIVVATLIFLCHKISVFTTIMPTNVVFGFTIIDLLLLYLIFAALQPEKLISNFLSLKPFVSLGKISYGLYIWHLLSLELTPYIIKTLAVPLPKALVAFVLTVLISYLSYYFFEQKFLKLKSKYSRVT